MARFKEPEARAAYLAMGSGRSLVKLHQQYTASTSTPPAIDTLKLWSRKREWARLAAEHDERASVEAGRRIARAQGAATAAVLKEAAQSDAMDKAWVLERLRLVVERSLQAEAVLDSEGAPIGEYKFNAAGANKALELVGKELGMFVERKEVGTPGSFDDLNTDDIRKQLASEIAALSPTGQRIAEEGGRGKPH